MRVVNVGDKAKVLKKSEMLATYCQTTVDESSDALVSEILQSAELKAKHNNFHTEGIGVAYKI